MQLKSIGLAAMLARCKVNYESGSWGQVDSLAVFDAMLLHCVEEKTPMTTADIAEFRALADMLVNPAACHLRLVDMKLLRDLGRKRGRGDNKFAALAAITTPPQAVPPLTVPPATPPPATPPPATPPAPTAPPAVEPPPATPPPTPQEPPAATPQ